jgi:DNA-binding transcriptional ArsR family regulator
LIEIKERVGALETIASISNRAVVEAYVQGHLTTDKGREIMRECAEPRTREHLISRLGFASAQALDHHLSPLREDDLLRQHFDDDGLQTFEWSNLFKRLPRSTLKKILENPD